MTAFRRFIERLREQLMQPLPGEAAQYRMAPYERRLRADAVRSGVVPRRGAVLALVYPINDIAHTVLMLRSLDGGIHSGQVSFPGGRREKGDASLQHTALREAAEETGVPQHKVTLLGPLTELFIPPSGFLVTPYVGYLGERPVFRPDRTEVEALIETPLHVLTDEATVKRKAIRLQARNATVNAPYFDVAGHVVWGATAMIISEWKAVLRACGRH